MAKLADTVLPAQPDTYGLLARAITRVRWLVIAVLFVSSFAYTLPTRTALPTWAVILLFAGYNLVVEFLRARLSWLQSFARVAILDFVVTSVMFYLGMEVGGPFFVLLVLTIFSAAVSMRPQGSIAYTLLVMMVVAALAPLQTLWSPTDQGIRILVGRLMVLAVVGLSTVILMHHLNTQRQLAQTARAEAVRLWELGSLRSDFISSVSHDLRTPLTAVRAGLGLLETSATERLRGDERQLLGNARRNLERLRILIDDLLIHNQLEAGALGLDHEPVDVRAAVTDSASVVLPLMSEKQQQLELDLPESLPTQGDARRLGQVFVNLIANAHQHTPAGTHVSIRGWRENSEIRVSVIDDGPGIPPEEHESVFQRFHRLATPDGGSGLGLAVTRAIVELHGGHVWVESEPGKGSAFHVSLPSRDGVGDL